MSDRSGQIVAQIGNVSVTEWKKDEADEFPQYSISASYRDDQGERKYKKSFNKAELVLIKHLLSKI